MYNKSELASYVTMGEVAYTRDKTAQAWDYIAPIPLSSSASPYAAASASGRNGSAGAPLIYELHALLTSLLGFAGLAFLYRNRMRAFAVLMALPCSSSRFPTTSPTQSPLPPQHRPPPHPPGRLRRHPTRHPLGRARAPHPLLATTGFLTPQSPQSQSPSRPQPSASAAASVPSPPRPAFPC